MKKLTEEQKKIAEENMNLVYFVINKFYKFNFPYVEKEELIQEGMYALIKCIPYYDETKGCISTFICKCVKKHISYYLLNRNDNIKTIPYENIEKDAIYYYDDYDIDVSDSLKEFLYKYLKKKAADMAVDHYINKIGWEELAEKYGYADRKAACAIMQQNFKRLSESDYMRNKFIDLFI